MADETRPVAVLAGRHVLLIEDEESLLTPIARYLERLGGTVLTAREREEAEALLENGRFDLIVLDLALSSYGLEGLDLLRSIRQAGIGTPVLVLSGLVNADVEAEAVRRGAHAVLPKPQPLPELARVALRLMVGS